MIYQMNDSVYENEHYRLVVGKSTHDGEGVSCYQIINKETEVVEMEVTVLPTAMQYADEFSTKLESMQKVQAPRLASAH